MEQRYFRKGLGLKQEVAGALSTDYHSRLIDIVRDHGYELTIDGLTFRLAREFGFCYGVDRAVDYAYQARSKFPDKSIYLVGEIIHNPHVNANLESKGIVILRPTTEGRFDFTGIGPADVVIIPAFGVTVTDHAVLQRIGCVLVDTTCGSVLNVWKRVEHYARDGFTALIHGKYYHEESKATASQVTRFSNGKYLIVRDMGETEEVCQFIEHGGDTSRFIERFAMASAPGFDPARDLERIGVANQTTMLAKESLAIAARVGRAMVQRYGESDLPQHFRTFDTICSATQERQDAIEDLISNPLDLMIVIGGYNSSNTSNLARICAARTTTYHIADASCIVPETGSIRHRPVGAADEVEVHDWLPAGDAVVGITAGASTPNNKIGEAMMRVLQFRGGVVDLDDLS
jgi:4-hydroxy-3-methylbut-2-en-1-yl diphosphate reductase